MDLSIVGRAIGSAINKQKKWFRRKDTIVTVVTGIIWLLAFLAPYLAGLALPLWVSGVIGGISTIGGALVNSLTQGAITPSMIERVEHEITSMQNVVVTEIPSGPAPVVPETAYHPHSDSEYVGEHRAPEKAAGGISEHYANG